jgi:FkbM family methyltransferase
MRLASRLKDNISRILVRYGYKIEKTIDFGDHKLDVFRVLLHDLNPDDPAFFFLQVGANDGRTGDPIRDFVKRYHWRGILVEPLPDAFSRLTLNYRDEQQLILENAAVAREDGTASIWTVADSNGLLATFDKAALLRRFRDSSRIVRVPIRTVSMKTLVETHHIDRVDLLQVDVEGFDYEVLQMVLDASSLRPRLIRYEHLHLSPAERRACVNFLAGYGYKLHRDDIDTIAYLQCEQKELLACGP